ncbi:hypothetical protein, partial [Treponema sp. R8-4-B8]
MCIRDSYNSWRKKQPFNIKGYDAFACIEYLSDNEKVRNSFKNNQFTIVCDIGGKEKTFNIPLKEKIRLQAYNVSGEMSFKTDDYIFWIYYISAYYYKSKDSVDLVRLDGYFFY